ncbi:MAG TPA: hypothetical protein PKE45_16175 [Caldilineaceae bacterium]|nr:hypothetical protein [Caldilineaceae bacterium]
MTHTQITKEQSGSKILTQVREGMTVFNRANKKIGAVEAIYLGTASEEERELGTAPATADSPRQPGDAFARMWADIFNPNDVPNEVAERLWYSGYLRIDAPGLFSADRFVTPEEIDFVAQDGVHLKVRKADRIEEV